MASCTRTVHSHSAQPSHHATASRAYSTHSNSASMQPARSHVGHARRRLGRPSLQVAFAGRLCRPLALHEHVVHPHGCCGSHRQHQQVAARQRLMMSCVWGGSTRGGAVERADGRSASGRAAGCEATSAQQQRSKWRPTRPMKLNTPCVCGLHGWNGEVLKERWSAEGGRAPRAAAATRAAARRIVGRRTRCWTIEEWVHKLHPQRKL